MKAHLIIAAQPETATILSDLLASDRPAYRACVNLLAGRRKLRTVVIDRKPLPERHGWMRTELTRRSNDDAATEVLQTWLLGTHEALIKDFLDLLKVPHNGHGIVETLPSQPDPVALGNAVNSLLEKYPASAVAAYLNLFVEMDIADWPALDTIISEDSRLCLEHQPTAI